MRSKKALAVLLAVSMVFSLNTAVFADSVEEVLDEQVSAEEVVDTELEIQSENAQSANSTVSSGDVDYDDDGGEAEIDKSDSTSATLSATVLNSVSTASAVKVELSGNTVTIPQSVLTEMGITGSLDISTAITATTSSNYPAVKFTKATQQYTIDLTVDGSAYTSEFTSGKLSIKFDASSDTKALGTGYIYCTSSSSPELMGTDDVSDGSVAFDTPHCSDFVVGTVDTSGGWVSGNFLNPNNEKTFVLESDGTVTYKYVGTVNFVDDQSEYETNGYVTKTATKSSGYKLTTPLVTITGTGTVSGIDVKYKPVKWITLGAYNKYISGSGSNYYIDGSTPSANVGEAITYDESLFVDDDGNAKGNEYDYVLIVEPVDTVSAKSLSANGHTIDITYNTTPAYSGKKLSFGDLGGTLKIDGKTVDNSLIKFKVKGKKTVGSTVTFTLKSIKGLDKDTNKALKGETLDTITIRAIQASDVDLWDKTYTTEGVMVVKINKKNKVKVFAVGPKNHKFDKSTGRGRFVARKIKIKKGFTYDSSTNHLTFDGTYASGTVKVSVVSK